MYAIYAPTQDEIDTGTARSNEVYVCRTTALGGLACIRSPMSQGIAESLVESLNAAFERSECVEEAILLANETLLAHDLDCLDEELREESGDTSASASTCLNMGSP